MLRRRRQADPAQIAAQGGNRSLIHIDWMIGSSETDIDGIHADGSRAGVPARASGRGGDCREPDRVARANVRAALRRPKAEMRCAESAPDTLLRYVSRQSTSDPRGAVDMLQTVTSEQHSTGAHSIRMSASILPQPGQESLYGHI
jgi:hypothetical protein